MNKIVLLITILNFGFLNAQIENGMIAHFPFNGNHNDISASVIVTNNVGTTFGNDRNATANQAVELGTDKYISFTDTAVKTKLPLTISAWVKFNSFAEMNVIFASDNVFDNYHGYWFYTVPNTGQVAFSYGAGMGGTNATNRRTTTTDTQLSIGVWYHLVAVIRAHKNMEIYFNCEKQPFSYSGSGATNMIYSSTESRIGSAPGDITNTNGWFCDGSIDQLAIWKRAITPAEINYLCDINNTLSVIENDTTKEPKEILKIINVLGQEVEATKNTPLIYIYSDGSTERIVITE
ncbi:MAG: LamG domain-containing protein [Crocinitomicaceae bacterium]|nr:LamG domain-containing protein [Crocinitomicaceae bacterium]